MSLTATDRAPLGGRPVGFSGRIVASTDPEPSLRLRELGFVPGTSVKVLRRGPLGDPVELELRGYRICLRGSDLEAILVEPLPSDASSDA